MTKILPKHIEWPKYPQNLKKNQSTPLNLKNEQNTSKTQKWPKYPRNLENNQNSIET